MMPVHENDKKQIFLGSTKIYKTRQQKYLKKSRQQNDTKKFLGSRKIKNSKQQSDK